MHKIARFLSQRSLLLAQFSLVQSKPAFDLEFKTARRGICRVFPFSKFFPNSSQRGSWVMALNDIFITPTHHNYTISTRSMYQLSLIGVSKKKKWCMPSYIDADFANIHNAKIFITCFKERAVLQHVKDSIQGRKYCLKSHASQCVIGNFTDKYFVLPPWRCPGGAPNISFLLGQSFISGQIWIIAKTKCVGLHVSTLYLWKVDPPDNLAPPIF